MENRYDFLPEGRVATKVLVRAYAKPGYRAGTALERALVGPKLYLMQRDKRWPAKTYFVDDEEQVFLVDPTWRITGAMIAIEDEQNQPSKKIGFGVAIIESQAG